MTVMHFQNIPCQFLKPDKGQFLKPDKGQLIFPFCVYFSVVSLSQMSLIIKAGPCESGFVYMYATFNFPVVILIESLEFE